MTVNDGDRVEFVINHEGWNKLYEAAKNKKEFIQSHRKDIDEIMSITTGQPINGVDYQDSGLLNHRRRI